VTRRQNKSPSFFSITSSDSPKIPARPQITIKSENLMASQSQIDANRMNAQKSTGPKTPEGKAKSRRNALQHGLTAKTCMLADEDPGDLLDLVAEIRKKFDPQDTDEDFLIERMAKARIRYNRIMPIEASIFNLRLVVDKAPPPQMEAQGETCQRAWALSKLSRYETTLLCEYDRSRAELEKLQKIRAAKPAPPPITDELRKEPDPPITPIKSAELPMRKPEPDVPNRPPPATGTPAPTTPNPEPSPEPLL
jgi:hypothetical protein